MLKQLLTTVLLGILLINAQAQYLNPLPVLSGWEYRRGMKVTG